MVITIFSAPNYCDMYRNQSAFLKMDDDHYEFFQLNWVDHPYYLPKFMDGFTYSLPFILENLSKLSEFFYKVKEENDEEEEKVNQRQEISSKTFIEVNERLKETRIKNKMQTVSQLRIMMETIRKKNESLINTSQNINIQQFEDAIEFDKKNGLYET
jgi:serine/threonine-protein phosphatase 2B catalytic subunit